LVENRADSALLTLFFLIVLILEFGGLAIIYFERASPEANITSAADALWYTYVTITTVGYGDTYPVTFEGRVVGFFIMTAGVGLFGTLTGYLANVFLSPSKKKKEAAPRDETDPKAKLAELRQLLVEQQQAQALLETKISELESLL
jgi:voltage-gated potassium channel